MAISEKTQPSFDNKFPLNICWNQFLEAHGYS